MAANPLAWLHLAFAGIAAAASLAFHEAWHAYWIWASGQPWPRIQWNPLRDRYTCDGHFACVEGARDAAFFQHPLQNEGVVFLVQMAFFVLAYWGLVRGFAHRRRQKPTSAELA